MAILHRAELRPSKLELLTGWLPARRWYSGPPEPALTQVASFRFDDPAGRVGIETLLVTAGDATVYQVPLTYRDAPLAGREDWLIGTMEHSVLGPRWIYDGCGDPVYSAALAGAILADTAQAEQFVETDGRMERLEPSMGISSNVESPGEAPVIEALGGVLDGDDVTSISTAPLALTVIRVLSRTAPAPSAAVPALTGAWSEQPNKTVLALAHRRAASG